MNIGVDLDDTLCDTKKVFLKYLNNYLFENKIDYFEWYSNFRFKERFYKKYLSIINNEVQINDGAKETIEYLRNKGCHIYIITNRSNKYGEDIYLEIKKYLFDNGIVVNEIFLVDDNKVRACLEHNIEYMIDDNKEICDELSSNGIKVICFGDLNETANSNYISVDSWHDVKKFFECKLK